MPQHRTISFSSGGARIQYHILMGLFRVAVTRGLYGRFARGLGKIFSAQNSVLLRQKGEPPFRIYLNDGYWTRFALFHLDYEPEVERVIRAAAGHTETFCDLGANKGYWSVRAAPHFPTILAVEASGQTFQALHENAGPLPNVTLHKRAIHAKSGLKLQFLNVPLSHASAHIAGESEGADETVETITIDDLLPEGTAALIKLDVEGAEIAAFDGGRRAMRNGSVFIYEDHGSDLECQPSAHLLRDPEIGLYSIADSSKRLTSVAAVRALKADSYKGYNFIAARQDSPLLRAILGRFANG